jgi:3-deoxy-manno-octulosonate cytidylyltransferase (CMP-KDO synthetase)
VVVNLQGDEPLIEPSALNILPDLLRRDPGVDVATLATPLASMEQYHDPNCVKVVCNERGRALYFSRSPIPYVREGQPDFQRRPTLFMQHLGLYAYRKEFLLEIAQLPPEPLEEIERLEQLRVLALGKGISVGVVEHAGRGVDTREDYQRFVATWRQQQQQQGRRAA